MRATGTLAKLPRMEDVTSRLPGPDKFESRARGPELTARVGTLLGIAFGICFLTGLWSGFQYSTPSWVPIGPHPTQLYRYTQGLHVISGVAAIPLLLVKLWSVYPRLFIAPPKKVSKELVLDLAEKASIGVLVAAAFFQLFTGLLNIAKWYLWDFSFRTTHEAVAWIAIGALLMHIAVKLPVIREAFGESIDHDEHHLDPQAPTRRTVLRAGVGASGLAVLLTAGETVPWLRRISVLSVRDGQGPQNLPINRTAASAGVGSSAAFDPDFALELAVGSKVVCLTRSQLEAMPQRTARLPIACVEGWSREAEWTGVSVRDLVELMGAPRRTDVVVRSMQTRGAFGASRLTGAYVADHRTMLALRLNGKPLTLDHGYPCRIIAPNRPGVFQTKWVRRLEVQA